MQPSIPVKDFVNPQRRSRAWNAVGRALELAAETSLDFIGEVQGERFYRVRAKGRDRHCVIRWFSQLHQEERASCDCEAFRVPVAPTHCFHVAAVLVQEAIEPPRKQASMGRKERRNGRPITPREENPNGADGRGATAIEVG